MTRKNALNIAIKYIYENYEVSPEKDDILKKLQECVDDLPLNRWSKIAIFDACDQYLIDNNKTYLTMGDFTSGKLPSHPAVKNRFGITLAEFRDKYYPIPEGYRIKPKTVESDESKINRFIETYHRVKPSSAKEYLDRKNEDDIGWIPCAKIVGVRNWDELLAFLGLSRYSSMQVKQSRFNSLADLEHILTDLKQT